MTHADLCWQVKPYCRPFRKPLTTAHGLWTMRRGLLVRVGSPSLGWGYGEVAPIPWFGSETLAAAIACLATLPPPVHLPPIPPALPACRFGLEAAWQGLHQPAPAPPAFPPAQVCALLPRGDAALTTWHPLWQRGHRVFKTKVGIAPLTQEQQWVEALAAALPPGGQLRLDANGGLDPEQTASWLRLCDRLNAQHSPSSPHAPIIAHLEQPLPPPRFDTLLGLTRQFRTPIALDESVATLADLVACHRRGWRGAVVIKPGIAGFASQIQRFCRRHRLRPVFSSVLETGVGRNAALQLAHQVQQQDPTHPLPALGFGTDTWFADPWPVLSPEQLWQRI